FVDGERVAGPNAQVAFMLQKDLLLPWRTVVENVTFGVEIQGVPANERKRRAASLLANFKLDDFAAHYPHQLSGAMPHRLPPPRGSPLSCACGGAVLAGRRADAYGVAARSGPHSQSGEQDRAADHP